MPPVGANVSAFSVSSERMHRVVPATLVRAARSPVLPERHRVDEGLLRLDRLGWRLVGWEPAKDERNAVALGHGERRNRPQVAALVLNGRAQEYRVGAGDGEERPVERAHPGDDRAVVEADDELHPHLDTSADSLDDPHEVGLRLARRHEVDEPHGTVVRLQLGLEDERVAPVPAVRRTERHPRAAIVQWPFSASPRSAAKQRARVEARQAQPVDGAVTADERSRLQVADEAVVLDERHYRSSSRNEA